MFVYFGIKFLAIYKTVDDLLLSRVSLQNDLPATTITARRQQSNSVAKEIFTTSYSFYDSLLTDLFFIFNDSS